MGFWPVFGVHSRGGRLVSGLAMDQGGLSSDSDMVSSLAGIATQRFSEGPERGDGPTVPYDERASDSSACSYCFLGDCASLLSILDSVTPDPYLAHNGHPIVLNSHQ